MIEDIDSTSENEDNSPLPNMMSNRVQKQSSIRRKDRLNKIVAQLRWQKCTNAAKAFARFNSISTAEISTD